MTDNERLRQKANSLPLVPGVYIMKDKDGKVIYVGKSRKLKNRVTSYFAGHNHTPKTAIMVSLVRDFDYIVCKTEIEALTLENVLIKKHTPKYNIKLKDAKSYPYIKVTHEPFPKLYVTRERKGDRAKYFGPYRSTKEAHDALKTVMRIFMLADCKRVFPRDIGKERPCMYKDIKMCVAPCTGEISSKEYKEIVKCAEWVLDGNVKGTKQLLSSQMQEAAEELEFERCAVLRDSIYALDRLSEKQKVVADVKVNRDVFSYYSSPTHAAIAMLSVRSGAMINKNEFILSSNEYTSSEDIVSVIADYYDKSGNIPREIMLDFPLSDEDLELLGEYLSLDTKYKVSVKIPERGDGRALCDIAYKNAMEAVKQAGLKEERENKNLTRLCELLSFDFVPKRIEAYDISNFGNESITASMVVYDDGKIKKSDFRIFNIKSIKTADDYASMREVIERRAAHIGDGSASLGERPDLILLDGGKTHVGAVKPVLEKLGLDIPVYGMVKDDFHKTRAITDGEGEISIAQERGVYNFFYKLQEHAHNFALKHSQRSKSKALTTSVLEKIPGIGPKKAKLLLAQMPLYKIKSASLEELSAIRGISKLDAENIQSYYKNKKEG